MASQYPPMYANHGEENTPRNNLCSLSRLSGVWIQWNGMMDWNGGMEWTVNMLNTSEWFSPPYNDHL